ncbi:hypothetical protein CDEF62S_04193 [Castellaniella defragrans]
MHTASAPFKITGALAIIAAGLIAAAIAYHPTKPVVWTVAYLVLVAGVVQYVLGAAQAALSARPPTAGTVGAQWLIWNLGHAGVIAGTLLSHFNLLIAGTALYDVAMLWLAGSVRGGAAGWRRAGYWLLILAMLASSLVGVTLTVLGD